MPKERIIIKFNNPQHLWQLAKNIKARNIEIKTQEYLLICYCSEEDKRMITRFGGKLVNQLSESYN